MSSSIFRINFRFKKRFKKLLILSAGAIAFQSSMVSIASAQEDLEGWTPTAEQQKLCASRDSKASKIRCGVVAGSAVGTAMMLGNKILSKKVDIEIVENKLAERVFTITKDGNITTKGQVSGYAELADNKWRSFKIVYYKSAQGNETLFVLKAQKKIKELNWKMTQLQASGQKQAWQAASTERNSLLETLDRLEHGRLDINSLEKIPVAVRISGPTPEKVSGAMNDILGAEGTIVKIERFSWANSTRINWCRSQGLLTWGLLIGAGIFTTEEVMNGSVSKYVDHWYADEQGEP